MKSPSSNKCGTCKGVGMLVREVPSQVYTCGLKSEAYTCPACLGTGRTMPVSMADDRKLAAAGDVR